MKRLAALVMATVAYAGCGGNDTASPTAPGGPLYTLSGIVRSQAVKPLDGVVVTVADGVYAGRASAATGADGRYTIEKVSGNLNAIARKSGYLDAVMGATTLQTSADFVLQTAVPWTQSGQGNTVFDIPSYIARVRIQGTWNRTDPSNFIVRFGGHDVVNEILKDQLTYDGIHLTAGVVEIVFSTNIAWSFTEVR